MPKFLLYEAAQKLGVEEDHEDWVCNKYLGGESCNQISQEIFDKTGISITPRGINYFIAKRGLIRTRKESFNNSIKMGRMKYPSKGKKFVRQYI